MNGCLWSRVKRFEQEEGAPVLETEGRADEPALQHSGLWRASAREVQGRTVRTVDDVNAAR